MNDQAQRLRSLARSRDGETETVRKTRLVAVTSGKGGVGKSNFTLNFALTLQAMGYPSLIFDADIGFANIDVLMGVHAPYSLYHLLQREKSIWDIIQSGYDGVKWIAGGSGFNDLIRLSDEDLDHFASEVELLSGHVDFIFFDTGAGLSKETLQFIVAAQETILITTPEPTSITDAYAMIKMIHTMGHPVSFKLVVNKVADTEEGRFTAEKIQKAAKRFLDLDIEVIGYLPDDSHVTQAVKQQIPFTAAYPHSVVSRGMKRLVSRYIEQEQANKGEAAQERFGMRSFFQRMIRFTKERITHHGPGQERK